MIKFFESTYRKIKGASALALNACGLQSRLLITPLVSEAIILLDRCRASRERSERDLGDRMAFWPAQLNAALRCMANSITVLWLS